LAKGQESLLMTKTNHIKNPQRLAEAEETPAGIQDDPKTGYVLSPEYAGEYQPDEPPAEQPPPKSGSLLLPVLLAVGLLLLVAGGVFGWQWWQSRSRAGGAGGPPAALGKPRGVPVKLARVQLAPVEESSEFVGTLEAQKAVGLKAEIDGLVREIYVKSGSEVAKGTSVARIESDTLEAELRQAKANQLGAEARLKELLAGSRPEEIARAKASLAAAETRLADAQAGAAPEEIAQAEAQLESAKAAAELTKQRVSRYGELAQQGAIAQDTLDQYIKEDRSAAAQLQEAERRLAQVRKGRTSDIERLKAEVEQQRQALLQLQNGSRPEEIAQAEAQVAQAAAQVRNAEAELERAAVVAPFAGTIGDIPVKLGDYVKKGEEMTAVTQNELLELRMPVPLERASDLRQGLPVQLSDSQGKSLGTGRVSFISPTVTDSQTVLAKAEFDNPQRQLLNGQFVRAKVIWNRRSSAVVPATAVVFQGAERFVFVAPGLEPAVAKRQPVKLGLVSGDSAEVIEGVVPGDTIIVSGIQKLADGAPIMPLPSGEGKGSKGAGEK
jgi:RND family efflux transporter MFP subunit